MAGGRLFSYFTRSMEEGRGEKEPSSLPRNVTSHECEQKSFSTWQRIEGWAGMVEPVYIPSCWEHACWEAGLKHAPAATASGTGSGHCWVVCGCTQAGVPHLGQQCHCTLSLCRSVPRCAALSTQTKLALVHSFVPITANTFSMAAAPQGLGGFSELLHNLQLSVCTEGCNDQKLLPRICICPRVALPIRTEVWRCEF